MRVARQSGRLSLVVAFTGTGSGCRRSRALRTMPATTASCSTSQAPARTCSSPPPATSRLRRRTSRICSCSAWATATPSSGSWPVSAWRRCRAQTVLGPGRGHRARPRRLPGRPRRRDMAHGLRVDSSRRVRSRWHTPVGRGPARSRNLATPTGAVRTAPSSAVAHSVSCLVATAPENGPALDSSHPQIVGAW